MKLELFEQYRGLPRQIYVLLGARIITAMGAFVYPFLTFFLSSRLHFSETEIGKYLLIVAVSCAPAALLGGKLADRFNRKRMYITMDITADVLFILAGFNCNSLSVVYFILFGYFFYNMGMPALSAMMMDFTNPSNRQESFSLVYLGYNLGFAIGPLVAGLLFEKYIHWIFWGQAMLGFAAMFLILFGISNTGKSGCNKQNSVPEKKSSHMESVLEETVTEEVIHPEDRLAWDAAYQLDESLEERITAESGGSLFSQLGKHPIVMLFAAFASVYAFAYAQMGYIMPLHMSDLFGVGAGSKYYGVICSLNGIAVVIATPFVVLWFKRFNPIFNLAVCGICYGIGFGAYAVFNNLIMIYLLVFIWTAGEALASTNTGVFIANHAPVTHRARFQSIYDLIQGTGRALGPLLMGVYLTGHTIPEAWLLTGSLCLLAVLGYLGMFQWSRKPKKQ